MKVLLGSLLVIAIAIASYQYGWHHGQAASKAIAASYQELYEQAIMWQHINCSDIPKLSPNIKLKEKHHE